MKKSIVTAIFLVTALLLCSQNVIAGTYGQSSPGRSISIDKLIATTSATKGGTLTFTDNLASGEPRFSPGDVITFKLKVKNTSNVKLTNVKVEDFLPGTVELAEGQTSFNAGDFNPGAEKEYIIKARVKSQDQLPADRSVFCEINRARASSEGVADDDTAQFCIEKAIGKQIPGAPEEPKKVPSSGPEMGILLLGGQLGLLGTGFFLKKRSS